MLENESKLGTSGSLNKLLRVPKSEGKTTRTKDKPWQKYPEGESLWPTRGPGGEQLWRSVGEGQSYRTTNPIPTEIRGTSG